MARRNNPRQLLVEGASEKRVIPELIEHNGVPWPDKPRPVEIQTYDGIGNLTAELMAAELKAPGLVALGVVVDADDNPDARWTSVREACLRTPFFDAGALPETPPGDGFILAGDDPGDRPPRPRFGVWIMPDNQVRGMLETFLEWLVPESDPILALADETVDEARTRGAPFKAAHRDKARVHTWLAWQDAPGRQLHEAVRDKVLDPLSPRSASFVAWFRKLYDL